MYKMRDEWTDERLDDFRDDVNRRFDAVDRRFDKVDRRFDKVDVELHRVNDRLDDVYRAQFMVGGGIIAALIGGFAAVVTQL